MDRRRKYGESNHSIDGGSGKSGYPGKPLLMLQACNNYYFRAAAFQMGECYGMDNCFVFAARDGNTGTRL